MNKLFVLLWVISSAKALAHESIVGGSAVNDHDFIAHSVVALVSSTSKGQALCTASLVANDLAVTAAHCVSDERGVLPSEMILAFSSDLHTMRPELLRAIDRAEVPAEWNPGSQRVRDTSDVALVHFKGGLPAGYVASDLLPFQEVLKKGDLVILSGYGISNAKAETGSGLLRKVEAEVLNPGYSPTEVQFDQSQGGGACHGDSGGPAYKMIKGHPYLFGITSRGSGDCNEDVIYTRISTYQEWFAEATKILRR